MFFFAGEGGRLLQRGEFIRFKGGSFTTIEFQRGFDRTPRTPPPTRLVWMADSAAFESCSFQEEMQSMKIRFPKESKKKGKKKKHSSLQLCTRPKILGQKKRNV